MLNKIEWSMHAKNLTKHKMTAFIKGLFRQLSARWHHGHISVIKYSNTVVHNITTCATTTSPSHAVHIYASMFIRSFMQAAPVHEKHDMTTLQRSLHQLSKHTKKSLEADEKNVVQFTWRNYTNQTTRPVFYFSPLWFCSSCFSLVKPHSLKVHSHKHTRTCTNILLAHIPPAPPPSICRVFKHQSRVV